MNLENFYIVATDPEEPALQVNISGPYLTRRAAQADLEAAIDEASELDPSARQYQYRICKLACQKPGAQPPASSGFTPCAIQISLSLFPPD